MNTRRKSAVGSNPSTLALGTSFAAAKPCEGHFVKAESADLHVLRWQDAEYPLRSICATAAHGSSHEQPSSQIFSGVVQDGAVPESSFSSSCCVAQRGIDEPP